MLLHSKLVNNFEKTYTQQIFCKNKKLKTIVLSSSKYVDFNIFKI